ncbi:MAG: DMT family transporter [Bacillota bacterium]
MQKEAHIAGIAFSIIFGFTFMFSKTALSYVTPIGLIAYRFLTAFLVFELIRRLRFITVRFQKAHLKDLLMVALFQPVLYFLLETFGLNLTTSAEAGMMIALIPIFTTILGTILLKEKPKLLQIPFILMSVGGIILIQLFKSGSEVDIQMLGFFLLFGAVISAALFNIASRKASTSLKPHELTYFMMLVGAVTFNVIYLIQLAMGGGIGTYISNLNHVEIVLPILYLGTIASMGGFFLVNYALSRLEAHVISVYANFATIVAVAAGAVFLNEALEYYHFIGGAMIIIGVYGTVRLNNGESRRAKRLFNRQK